jgi:hypothetical protein
MNSHMIQMKQRQLKTRFDPRLCYKSTCHILLYQEEEKEKKNNLSYIKSVYNNAKSLVFIQALIKYEDF